MKPLILCLFFCLSPSFFTGQAGDIGEETEKLTEIRQVESSLDAEARDVSGNLSLDGSYDTEGAIARLWNHFLDRFLAGIKKETKFAWKILLTACAASMVMILIPDQKRAGFAELGACCTAALLLIGSAESVIPETRDALFRLSDYGKAAFPAYFMTVAACGASVSASVKYASVSFASNLYMELCQRALLPIVNAYLAVGIAGSLAGNGVLKALEKFLKWSAVSLMTLFTGVFCTYIGISGIASGSADAVAVKAAKTVIASLLPVVGGIVSDSASTILAAATTIKSSAGVFCLIAVCAICAGPFAVLLAKMLLLKAVAAVSEMGCCERFARLVSVAGNAMGLLLGMIGSYGVTLFYSFMSGLRIAA